MADGTQAPGMAMPEEAELRSPEEAAPTGTPPQARARYDGDEYGWLMEQAGLLQAGRLEEIDRASLVEFLNDLAVTHRTTWQSALTVLLHHMLKVLVQPERMTRSWLLTITVQQQQARLVMEGNPGMRRHLPELYAKAYADARRRASAETGIALSRFPVDSPWTLDEALAFVPPEPPRRGRRVGKG
jgi:hypothetical protein